MMRQSGELLHPAREDAALISQAKRELGSFAFAAQYQQNPLPMEGGMIKRRWFRRYAHIPHEFDKVVQSWDTAIKAGSNHDCSVCLTFGETKEGAYLLDVQVLKQEYPELKRSIIKLTEQWQPDAILMEDKASGQRLLQELRRETYMPLIAMIPTTDKVTRVASASAMIEAGRLFLPNEAHWLAAFESELLGFPKSAHDDQVDALSQYLTWLKRNEGNNLRIRKI